MTRSDWTTISTMNGGSDMRKNRPSLRKTDIKMWQELFDAKRKRENPEPEESPAKYVAIDHESSSDETDFEESASQESNAPLSNKAKVGEKKVTKELDSLEDISREEGEIASYESDEESDEKPSSSRSNTRDVSIPGTPKAKELVIVEFPTPTKDPTTTVEEDDDDELGSPPLSPVLRPRQALQEPAILEYSSPVKKTNSSKISTIDKASLITENAEDDDTGDDEELEDVGSYESKSSSKSVHDGNRFQSVATMPVFNVEDAVTLSLVVVRSCSLGDAEGILPGSMVWSLCYDTMYECQRYVIFIEKANKKIKPGVCIRLFSPWLLSSLPYLNQQVIHSVDLYQILVPGILSISSERVREIISSSSISYSTFKKSIPGKCATQVLDVLPQLKYHPNTVRKQVSAYREKLMVDGMVWIVFELPDTFQVILQDCDFIFTLIEVPKSIIKATMTSGSFCRFSNLLNAGRVTEHSYTPLFSVLRSLGSNQDSYHKLFWTVNTTMTELNLDLSPIPAPDIKHICLTLTELQSVHTDGRRVATKGVITLMTKSELYLSDSDCKVRILLLNSFNLKNLLKPSDIGKVADVFFLRLSDGAIGSCAMDQYSIVTVNPVEEKPSAAVI